jgi:hypothetical protein
MAMRGQVHRHAVDVGGEVGAVIEVEAAQEILVGLALAGVLGGHQPRHGFHDVAGTQQRTRAQLPRGDDALARAVRNALQVLAGALDDDFVQGGGGRFPCLQRQHMERDTGEDGGNALGVRRHEGCDSAGRMLQAGGTLA